MQYQRLHRYAAVAFDSYLILCKTIPMQLLNRCSLTYLMLTYVWGFNIVSSDLFELDCSIF